MSQMHHFNRKEPPLVEASCSNPSYLPSVYGPDGPDGLQRKWTMSTSPAASTEQLLSTVVWGGGVVAFSIQPESHFNLHLSSEAGEQKKNKATVVINDPKE